MDYDYIEFKSNCELFRLKFKDDIVLSIETEENLQKIDKELNREPKCRFDKYFCTAQETPQGHKKRKQIKPAKSLLPEKKRD